jgi:hypothetical protein
MLLQTDLHVTLDRLPTVNAVGGYLLGNIVKQEYGYWVLQYISVTLVLFPLVGT